MTNPQNEKPLFQIDWENYDTILAGVHQAAPQYQPHEHWLEYEKKAVTGLKAQSGKVFDMKINGVPGWVGGGTPHHEPWEHYDRYIPFIKELDQLKILDRYPTYKSRQFLDAVAEINLLHRHCGLKDGLTLMDLGGGYGRLAEFLLQQFKVNYVVVEAVAMSMLVGPQYIAQALGCEVNSYWEKKDPNFKKYSFSVYPTWEIENIIPQADILINTHSMQEMGDEKAHFYLNTFARLKKQEAFVFLKNNYRYVTRDWNFPQQWQTIYENPAWPCTEGLVDGVWQDEPRTWLKIFK